MLKASERLCIPGAASVIHTLIRSPRAGEFVSGAEPGARGGGVTVPTPWDTLAGGCTCCVTSPWRATDLCFRKLQAFCVHASHHIWIFFFFLFWEILERNVVEILQRSTSAGWREAPSVTNRTGNPSHPSRCAYTWREHLPLSQPTPCPAEPRILQPYSTENWKPPPLGLTWCPRVSLLFPLPPASCVMHFFCIYCYGDLESCQFPQG